MFQLDPGFSSAAMDELVADVRSPVSTHSPALNVPVVANENHSTYIGLGTVGWEDEDYFYVFDD